MKKYLLAFLFMVLIAGSFSLFSACKNNSLDGVYKLSYKLYNNGQIVSETAELMSDETYIKISGNKIEEYIFEKSDVETKILISYRKLKFTDKTFPKFESKNKVLTDYTNLTGSLAGNEDKITRSEYKKAKSIPVFYQMPILNYFGEYENTENEDETLTLNGTLKLGEEKYNFIKIENNFYEYKKESTSLHLKFSGGKIYVYENIAATTFKTFTKA